MGDRLRPDAAELVDDLRSAWVRPVASSPRRPPERPKARRRHRAPTAGAAREQGGRRRRRRRLLRPRSGCRLRARLVWQLERSAPLEQQMWRRPSPSTMSRARPGTRRHRARGAERCGPSGERNRRPTNAELRVGGRNDARVPGSNCSEQRQNRPNGLAQVGRCPKRRRHARARAEVADRQAGCLGPTPEPGRGCLEPIDQEQRRPLLRLAHGQSFEHGRNRSSRTARRRRISRLQTSAIVPCGGDDRIRTAAIAPSVVPRNSDGPFPDASALVKGR